MLSANNSVATTQLRYNCDVILHHFVTLYRGGSRISCRGVDPFWGVVDLQRGHFLVKMYVKTKESGTKGGVCVPENFVCRSANVTTFCCDWLIEYVAVKTDSNEYPSADPEICPKGPDNSRNLQPRAVAIYFD